MADDLGLFADDGDDHYACGPADVTPPAPASGGLVVTLPMSDGSLLRVATVRDEIRLTLATADGMVTVVLDSAEASLVDTALDLARRDVRHRGGI